MTKNLSRFNLGFFIKLNIFLSSFHYFDFFINISQFFFSHRPLDLDNVYNQNQVKIIIKEGDTFDEIPDFDKVFDTQVCFSFQQNLFHVLLITSIFICR